MSRRKRTTPGEIVALILVIVAAAGAIWAGLNGYVPEGIGRGTGKIIGIPLTLAVVGLALAAGYGVNRLLGIEQDESAASEEGKQQKARREGRKLPP